MMKQLLPFLFILLGLIGSISSGIAQQVFINEIHYENDGADVDEGIELAGTSGTDLTDWKLLTYNGLNGVVYRTFNLSGSFPNQDDGFGTLFFVYPRNGLQNGSPDGIALVNAENEIVQFLGYEGSFTGVGGPADGIVSEEIGVQELETTPVGFSLQLTGTGTKYADFTWADPAPKTYNQINTGQSFGGNTGGPNTDTLKVSIAEARLLAPATEVMVQGTLTASDQFGGPAYLQDATGGIPVFDSLIHGTGSFQIGDEIKITAKLGQFNQQVQLVEISAIESLGPSEPVQPKVVNISELSDLEGQLVTVPAATFLVPAGLLFPESNYLIFDASGSIELRIDSDVNSLIGRVMPGSTETITGVLGNFRGTLQLLPRFIQDLPGTSPYVAGGSDIPQEETLDIMTWNTEFFGAAIAGFGPADVDLQLENVLQVIQATTPDIIAVQEISDPELLKELTSRLWGYALICSDRYSRSFESPDPSFPPQQLCFIYNTEVIEVISDRVMFETLYDEVRTGISNVLDAYPTGTASSFWSSGRLPYLLEVDANINGTKERINFINIHAKSGATASDLERRRFDNQVLKDSLDTFYSDANVILLGDYNDDLDESIGGGPSTYEVITNDPDYHGISISLSKAGLRSFLFNDNIIDHITLSNELYDNYLEGSEQLYIPFNTIFNYANTTSDHLPVIARLISGDPITSDAGEGGVVYFGYRPLESIILTADNAGGGDGEYTYTWSDGQVGQQITVSPTETSVYTLTVTDESGNSFRDDVQVCVVDVRCGRGGNKVQICLQRANFGKKQTLCVAPVIVPALLRRGAILGLCDTSDCKPVNSSEEVEFDKVFKHARVIRAYPNPFSRQIQVVLNQSISFPVTVTLHNFRGNVIYRGVGKFQNGESYFDFNSQHLQNGLYYLHLNYGLETKVIRLIKW